MVLCPQCNEENPPKFRLCGYCGAPLAPAAPPLPPREVRRTVTIIFSDLKGSTELGESLDPEVLHDVKERYFQAMAAEITRHGGKIEKYIGDAIMAVFGLPQPHEDDALRAVRAAAGMQEALKRVNVELGERYGVALANRTGINTGEVVAVDDPQAAQKLATGDAVNVAARLEQAAPTNEIYLGAVTHHLVRDAIEAEAVEPLTLKGKSEPVAAFRLIAARGLDGYARREDSPIVGREDEIAAVDRILGEITNEREARLVTIFGHAGIGKSRLAREVIARAGEGARIVKGRCLAYGDGITFWPLREIAGGAAGIRADDGPAEARAKLAELIGDDDVVARIASAIGLSEGAFALHEVNWAARKLFERLAVDGPLVALIDDIHWAEPAFLDLIEHVLDSAENAPILLLATARPDLLEKRPAWAERDGALRIELKPLSDAAAARVAENLLGASFPADVAARIVAAAEGNPLYVEQILAMLVDTKAIRKQDDGQWVRGENYGEIDIPPTIKALLEARLGQLAPGERTAIEPASVIGLQVAAPAVASLAPERARQSIEEQLANLTRKQFVHALPSAEDAELIYRFHHHLVRDTVYGSLLKRVRANLHVDFVKWADKVNAERGRGLEFEEILGYHLESAHRYLVELGPLDERGHEIGRDASRRLASAGGRAFGRGDAHASENLLRRAIALLQESDPLRLPLLPQHAEVLLELGRFDDARSLVEHAHAIAALVGNDRVRAAADLVRMHVRLHKAEPGNWSEATQQLTSETIPLLEQQGAHAELARAWRLVALTRQVAGSLGNAGDAILKVVTHARAAGDERFVARSALGLTFNVLYGPTSVREALQQCESFVTDGMRDRLVQGLIMCKVAQLRAMNGDFADARTLYHQARSLLDDLGQSVNVATTSFDLGMVELLAGDPVAAERAVRPDYETLQAMGATYLLSSMGAILARAVRAQGRDDEALELTEAVESAAADDDVDAQVLWRGIRAPILARAGQIAEAEALARAAHERARQTEMPELQGFALTELASALQLAGRIDEARAAMADAIVVYAKKGDVASEGRARRLLAMLERAG